jgi:hypothetical protein
MPDPLSSSVDVLTSMITPAVLISASGTLILSTSNRLGRVVDRVRDLSDRFEELSKQEEKDEGMRKKLEMIFDQLDSLPKRARLLQRAQTTFYLAVGIFVATSVAIGFVAVTATRHGWIPSALGILGASLLFYGSLLLITEARIALGANYREMNFLWEMGQDNAPSELRRHRQPKKRTPSPDDLTD